jgi:membrane associated rhomboid family serine protease
VPSDLEGLKIAALTTTFQPTMLENRDYMRQSPDAYGSRWSATVVLLIVNAVAFVFQKTALPHLIDERLYLDLSLDGLRHGYVWQLFTFQFLHGGWLHLILNCWALYIFGREVEWTLGKARFLTLYFSGGVIGGLFQALVALIWPHYFNSAVVGASAGIFGVVSAFAMLFPERQLTMLIMFILPVNMRAKYLLVINLVITALGIAFPETLFGGNVAHAAHLGGILTGLAFIRLREEISPVSRAWGAFSSSPPREPAFKLPRWSKSKAQSPADAPPEEFISREVDPILDKISAHGIQSLTEHERKVLEAARNKMAKS